MPFLKNEKFTFNGESVLLHELSALQRIEYLQYLAKEEKVLPDTNDNEQTAAMVSSNIKAGALIVGQSLWHNDPDGPSAAELQAKILISWPPEAIGQADMQVKVMSGMIQPDLAVETPKEVNKKPAAAARKKIVNMG